MVLTFVLVYCGVMYNYYKGLLYKAEDANDTQLYNLMIKLRNYQAGMWVSLIGFIILLVAF